MVLKCIVCGITNISIETCDIPMHSVPKNDKRAKLWCELLGFDFKKVSRYYTVVCGRHFHPSQYTVETRSNPMNILRRRLKSNAVPTLITSTEWNKMVNHYFLYFLL